MAMNLDAVLKIDAQVSGTSAVSGLTSALASASNTATGMGNSFKEVAKNNLWQGLAVGATAVIAGLALATRESYMFESAMSDVRKVVDGMSNTAAFAAIKTEIINLSRQTPIAAEGIAAIYAAAGRSGIAAGEIKEFAMVVIQAATAFGMTAEEAGTALSQIRVQLGMTVPEMRDLADAINYVDDNSNASAQGLIDFMTRSASVGKIAGLSATETLSFGAAMTGMGVTSEVAATSFNNMVKALSRGPSMTDRQVSALQRLGYTMVDAKGMEQQLTREAEMQSEKRIRAAEDETNAIKKEINRRYRDQMRALNDSWSDQDDANNEAIRDREATQSKALQRQMDAEIDALRETGKARGIDTTAQENQIRDSYEKRIDALRDAADDEAKLYARKVRDERQVIEDGLEDKKELEITGADERYKAIQKVEQTRLEESKKSAKESAEAMANEWKQGFADRFQKDAAGTITDVLNRIKNLPDSQKVSVISDLFGDEARGLAPMIGNLGELERVLGLATDKTKTAGSMAREFGIRMETAAAKAQLFKNNITALQIAVGDSLLVLLVRLAEAVKPFLDFLVQMSTQFPQATAAVTIFAAALAGLVLAMPAIAASIYTFVTIKTALAGMAVASTAASSAMVVFGAKAAIAGTSMFKLGAMAGILGKNLGFAGGFMFRLGTIAGTMARGVLFVAWVIGQGIAALKAFVVAGAAVIAGFITWPVIIGAALVAAAAAIYVFREPIMKFFAWIGEAFAAWYVSVVQWAAPVLLWWDGIWTQVKTLTAGFFTWIGTALYNFFVLPFVQLWEQIKPAVIGFWEWIKAAFTTAFTAILAIGYFLFVTPWVLLWEKLKPYVTGFWLWIQTAFTTAWTALTQVAYNLFVLPWVQLWEALKPYVTNLWLWMQATISEAWSAILQTSYDLFVQPWVNLWNLVLREPITQAWEWMKTTWAQIAGYFDQYVTTPIGTLWTGVVNKITEAWRAVSEFIPKIIQAAMARVREIFSGIAGSIANGINSIINSINNLIKNFNEIAAATKNPFRIQYLKTVAVPTPFAQGGFVTAPTLGLVGEAGREYIVPEGKAAGFANNIMAGRSGARAIPSGNSTAASSRGGGVIVNITTGPLTQIDGRSYATLEDLESAARQTATQIYATLRTPAGRRAIGVG